MTWHRVLRIGVSGYPCLILAFLIAFSGCNSDRKATSPKPASNARKTDQIDFQSRVNHAIGLMGKYQYSDAYAEFARLHAEHPNDLELAVDTAIARLNMAGDEDVAFAMNLLEAVLKKDPGHLRANYAAGVLKIYQGPPADPQSNFGLVAKADPVDADAAYLYAQSLEQNRDWATARLEYERCLALDQNYASAMLGLSRLARQASDSDAAMEWIRRFEELKANPNSRIFEFVHKRMGKYIEVSGSATLTDEIPLVLPDKSLFAPPTIVFSLEELSPISETSTGLVTADINSDDRLDLIVLAPFGNNRHTELRVLLNFGNDLWRCEQAIPWSQVDQVNAVLCGDVDDDGRVDVYLCRQGENQLWLQTQENEWTRSADPHVGGGAEDTINGLLFDADHDGDLDIFCVNRDGPGKLLNNNRDGSFRELEKAEGFVSQLTSLRHIVAGDFDNDRDLDLYLVGNDASELLCNGRQWKYRVEPLPPELAAPGLAVCVDLDHDGRLDLLKAVGEEIACFHFCPPIGWKEWRRLKPSGSFIDWDVTDLDADGVPEITCLEESGLRVDHTEIARNEALHLGSPILGWSLVSDGGMKGKSLFVLTRDGRLNRFGPGQRRANFVSLEFCGKQEQTKSMRSNRSGIGTRWKARTSSRWTTGMNLPANTLRGQSQQPVMIGTGNRGSIDILAIDWSDGVFQSEMGLGGNGVNRIEETQRQLASCPLVFAWDGQRYRFVTDVLGVGGLGFLAAPGQYAAPRPWENLVLRADQLRPSNNRLAIKIGEPMEEACILADAQLITVDLPMGWEVILDERAGVTDPQPTGALNFFRRSYSVISASNEHQIDQLKSLIAADGVAADPGPLDERFIGLLEKENILEFSFEQPVCDVGDWALAIDGWIEYPYSQTVFAAAQAQRTYDAPTLEVSRDGRDWKTHWAQVGYPAGMPRQMLIPLKGDLAGVRHFRLRTTMQVYWDRLRLVELEKCRGAALEARSPETALLRRVGFARRTTGPQFRPFYDYQIRSPSWDARHLPGFYTAFGDVTDRLGSEDPIIFGPGEEVHLEFKEVESRSDAPQSDFRRLCVLQLRGWCKDMDLFTENSNELGAIPSGKPELRSGDREAAENQNSRFESGPWYSYPVFMRGSFQK